MCVWGGGGGGAEGKCPPNRNMAYWCKGDRHCKLLCTHLPFLLLGRLLKDGAGEDMSTEPTL